MRVTGFVLLAADKFKRMVRKSPEGESADKIKFQLFSFQSNVTADPLQTTLPRLSDLYISKSLEYLFKKTTTELSALYTEKELLKIGVFKDGIIYSKTRMLEGAELRSVDGLKEELNLRSLTGIDFNAPMMSRFSPVAICLANYLHYDVHRHKGHESIYRLSLQHIMIIKGRSLFKEISDDCVLCMKLRRKYVEAMMGPLADCQLSISPVFYDTVMDLWGDLRVYAPGFQRVTRTSKDYKMWVLVLVCAATGTVNTQVIEGRSHDYIMCGLNRFFIECGVPKVMFPDKEGGIMKALNEGELSLQNMQGQLSRERGIYFETCAAQNHSAHGRVERKIRMLQEALTRSSIKTERLTATGWMTTLKLIERDVNMIPLGFLTHTGDETSLLRVLTPSMLKLNNLSNRAPVGVFQTPDSANDMMSKITDTYRLWYKVFSTAYIPYLMVRQKWNEDGINLSKGDIVYFKLTESPMGSDWRVGKVEHVKEGRDGVVREVVVAYKHELDGTSSCVERPARNVVRLFNIDDTPLIDQCKDIEKFASELLRANGEWVTPFQELEGTPEQPVGIERLNHMRVEKKIKYEETTIENTCDDILYMLHTDASICDENELMIL